MKKLHLHSLTLAALTVVGLLLSSSASRAQTSPWPVGDWDLVFSGSQKGLAVITFSSDNTLTGYEIVRPTPPKSSSRDIDPRHPGTDEHGNPVTTTNGTITMGTNLLGSAPLNGIWYSNAPGKAIGILNQLSQTVEPVETYSTNQLGEVITNVIFVVKSETNAVSFKASGVAGSRMTICSYGPNGNNVLRGKPVDTLQADQTGDYYAIGKRGGLNFVEFLSLQQDSGFPTRYDIGGAGPGYSYTGRALVSRSKQIAIVTLALDGSSVLSVYTGSFNLVSHKGKLGGLDSNNQKLNYNLNPLP